MLLKKNKTKYLYVVFNWGADNPSVYRSKLDLVNHLGKSNSRVVDDWFENTWFTFINDFFVFRIEIPKMKSKIRI